MGSTEIINQSSKTLDVQIGNSRYFIKLTTIGKNQTYVVHVDYNDTYMEYSFTSGDAQTDNPLIVSSDDCVDNKKIVITEVDVKLHVEMEPRVMPTIKSTISHSMINCPSSNLSNGISNTVCERARKRPCTSSWLRVWIL